MENKYTRGLQRFELTINIQTTETLSPVTRIGTMNHIVTSYLKSPSLYLLNEFFFSKNSAS
jgi:hypothetical protein